MQMINEMRSHYERIGGAEKVRELVQKFYQLMDELPEAHRIRQMHHINLQSAEDKLFMFLSGWMGGPQLFVEKFGHPRLRMRHLPFSIGEEERDQWMLCMSQALENVVADEALRTELIAAFYKVADFMRNQEQ